MAEHTENDRKACMQKLDDLIVNQNAKGTLLKLYLENFKYFNDTFGHAEGDRVLAEVGRIIGNNCRSEDVAGRIGGDEFMIFMRNISAADNASALAKRIQKEVADAFADDPLAGHISFSIGIALGPEHGKIFDDLFKRISN